MGIGIAINKYFMRHILIGVMVFLSGTYIYSQDTSLNYRVTNYSINGREFDDLAIEANIALQF
jgi:hypothetical protein